MKILILILSALMTIDIALANVCDSKDVTVVYVNGILSKGKNEAQNGSDEIKKKFKDIYPNKFNEFRFTPALNPSHLEGVGDLAKSVIQTYFVNSEIDDVDTRVMAEDLAKSVTTQKIILLGHSQGTFYANNLYKYALRNGKSPYSIAILNIATPASEVAGGGMYITSRTDTLINYVRDLQTSVYAPAALPGNITLYVSNTDLSDTTGSTWAGHSLLGTYLPQASAEIADDIVKTAHTLQSVDIDSGECFPLSYETKTQQRVAFVERAFLSLFDTVFSGAVHTYAFLRESITYAFTFFIPPKQAVAAAVVSAVTTQSTPSVPQASGTRVAVLVLSPKPKEKVAEVSTQASAPTQVVKADTSHDSIPESSSLESLDATVIQAQQTPLGPLLQPLTFGAGVGGGGSSTENTQQSTSSDQQHEQSNNTDDQKNNSLELPKISLTTDQCITDDPCIVKSGDVQFHVSVSADAQIDGGASEIFVPLTAGDHVVSASAKNAAGTTTAVFSVTVVEDPLLFSPSCTPVDEQPDGTFSSAGFFLNATNTLSSDISDVSFETDYTSDVVDLFEKNTLRDLGHSLVPPPATFIHNSDVTVPVRISRKGHMLYSYAMPVHCEVQAMMY